MHVGIDYGSKLAGTTVICWSEHQNILVAQSEKKQDADQWLSNMIRSLDADEVFLDAPLSLPGAYFGQGTDYFYRACDHELRAMSPMFLGGLTARAMKLSHSLADIKFYETYPKALVAQTPTLLAHYQKKKKLNASYLDKLKVQLHEWRLPAIDNWHQADAVLAWWSGMRYQMGIHLCIGNADEGQIII